MNIQLLGFVREQVAAYQGSLAELARETGLPYSWLRMFAGGHIPNPGVLQIELLAAHFDKGASRAAPAAQEARGSG